MIVPRLKICIATIKSTFDYSSGQQHEIKWQPFSASQGEKYLPEPIPKGCQLTDIGFLSV